GDAGGTTSTTFYDARRRPVSMRTERTPTGMVAESLSAVTAVTHQRLIWDGADNLIELHDLREASEWPDGFRPQTARVLHDALYRVAAVDYEYSTAAGWSEFDNAQDWRAELEAANTDGTTHRGADPMRTNPAESVSALPSGRVVNLTYTTDWLANSVEWTDDESVFYERSIGDITNGSIADGDRPAAMRLSTNLPDGDPGAIDITLDRGGWVTLDYGESGNVVAMTVRGQCRDIAPAMGEAGSTCFDDRDADLDTRRTNLEARCRCDREQHYEYFWDEVGRLNGAFRRDRNGVGDWTLAVRQRYRYDGGFQRVVKETIAVEDDGAPPRRATLYVYPGDFERRGMVPNFAEDRYDASVPLGTETQYMASGARVVWKNTSDDPTQLDRDHRITLPIANLIQSTSAVIDLQSGELLESSCYYPNGARESLRTQHEVGVATEPMGFTGKEADEEVGLVYLHARYLIPRLGRFLSSDPAHVHLVGGGEFGNSYHYTSAQMLQASDPTGLGPQQALTKSCEAGSACEQEQLGNLKRDMAANPDDYVQLSEADIAWMKASVPSLFMGRSPRLNEGASASACPDEGCGGITMAERDAEIAAWLETGQMMVSPGGAAMAEVGRKRCNTHRCVRAHAAAGAILDASAPRPAGVMPRAPGTNRRARPHRNRRRAGKKPPSTYNPSRGSANAGETYHFDNVTSPATRARLRRKYPQGVRFDTNRAARFEPYSLHVNGNLVKARVPLGVDGHTYSNSFRTATNQVIEQIRAAHPNVRVSSDGKRIRVGRQSYTWHHNEDAETMILAPTDLHGHVGHVGGGAGHK
ncbi:MAG: RHS repeat-associated core domain-containing protein, partial [Myxococcota bacterium]